MSDDQVSWTEKASCKDLDTSMFFELYEKDADMAKTIDNICLSCPVAKECFEYGCSSNSWGLWGGVFLVEGKPDNARNAHKDKEIWKEVLDNIYG
jgi:hypothetical protein